MALLTHFTPELFKEVLEQLSYNERKALQLSMEGRAISEHSKLLDYYGFGTVQEYDDCLQSAQANARRYLAVMHDVKRYSDLATDPDDTENLQASSVALEIASARQAVHAESERQAKLRAIERKKRRDIQEYQRRYYQAHRLEILASRKLKYAEKKALKVSVIHNQ